MIQQCVVSEVVGKGCRVAVGGMVSSVLPVMKTTETPLVLAVGNHVVVAFTGNGYTHGVILGKVDI